jgi:hypothetical protein
MGEEEFQLAHNRPYPHGMRTTIASAPMEEDPRGEICRSGTATARWKSERQFLEADRCLSQGANVLNCHENDMLHNRGIHTNDFLVALVFLAGHVLMACSCAQEEPPIPKAIDRKKLESKRIAKDWYTLLPNHLAVAIKKKSPKQQAKRLAQDKTSNATKKGKHSAEQTFEAKHRTYEIVDVTNTSKHNIDDSDNDDEESRGTVGAVVRSFELQGRNGTTVRLVKIRKKDDKRTLRAQIMQDRVNRKAFVELSK